MNASTEYVWRHSNLPHTDSYIWRTVSSILCSHPPPCKLFDLGCGNGSTANQLDKMGYDIIAVDPSTSGIAQGRQAFPHLKLFNGSAYDDLAQIYGQFSIVISLEVVEHCYDPRAYVRTFYDLLEPGGLGILSTPYHGYTKNLALALTGKLDRHFTALWDGGHIKFFSPTTLTALLVEAGFERPDIWRVGRIPPLAKSMIATFVKPRSIQNWA